MDLPLRITRSGSCVPIYLQIYKELRRAIVLGRLKPGSRLPSTRELASDLGVSRNTVMQAFAQLDSEGYLKAAIGSGTYVASALPDAMLNLGHSPLTSHGRRRSSVAVSRFGRLVQELPSVPRPTWRQVTPFYPGLPAYEALPADALRQAFIHLLSTRPSHQLCSYGPPAGYPGGAALIAARRLALLPTSPLPGKLRRLPR